MRELPRIKLESLDNEAPALPYGYKKAPKDSNEGQDETNEQLDLRDRLTPISNANATTTSSLRELFHSYVIHFYIADLFTSSTQPSPK